MLVGPAYNDSGLVFATPIGTAIDPSNVRRTWISVTQAAGWSGFASTTYATLTQASCSPKGLTSRSSASALGTVASPSRSTSTATSYRLQAQAAADLEMLLSGAKTKAI